MIRIVAHLSEWGLLHYIVPRPRGSLKLLTVFGVYLGVDMPIRAWSVYEKRPAVTT